MVTGVQDEIRRSFPGTSSGKRKRAFFIRQTKFRNENTPATNEADQILWALQQLASNSNSARFDIQQQYQKRLENARIPRNDNAHF